MSAPAIEISALPNLTPVLITGNDTRKFLQGQLSSDLRELSPDRGLLASYNSAAGRVCAILSLLVRPEGVFALIPTLLLSDTLQRLSRFVLREQIAWTDAREHWAIAEVSPDDLTTLALPTHLGTRGECACLPHATLLRWWSVEPRYLLLIRRSSVRLREPRPEQHDLTVAFRRAEIASGLPSVQAATSDAFLPQMLNLDLLGGVSYDKGCYLGQAVIARARQKPLERRMFRFRAAGAPPPAGTRVMHAGAPVGAVIDAVACGTTTCELLAVVDIDVFQRAAALQLDDTQHTLLTALELPYVTARAQL